MSNETTWTEAEMREFKRIFDGLSSANQMTRISARLNASAFEKNHGKAKCNAMSEVLAKGDKK